MTSAYERFLRPLLFRMAPETAHQFSLGALQLPGARFFLRHFATEPQPVEMFGLKFRNCLGLAAGFDKNAVAIPAWEALGFGFVEVGTVTARPQPGNPRPRIFRYPQECALINRLGFNNDGAETIARRLQQLRNGPRQPSIPIGVNIGKSKVTPLEEAPNDYLFSFRQLHPVADYIALNVSSPNTPGLRALQEAEALRRLLGTVTEENARLAAPCPILLKIAPDLSDEAIEEIIALCEEFGIAGIIATNTTLDHGAIAAHGDETGGLSGPPLRTRANEIARLLRMHTQLPIVGVGGIDSVEVARERLAAGAQLLQIYTGFIYRGPGLLRQILEDSRSDSA